MAWTTPSSLSTGTLVTAAEWNNSVVGNPIALRAGAIALTSQAIGDLTYASSTTQLGRVAAVAAGQVLTSAGTGTVPAYSATPALTSVDMGGTTVYASRAITVDTGGVLNIVLASAAGDDFTVDTDKLVVEGDTGNVGINVTDPGVKLEVSGDCGSYAENNAQLQIIGATDKNMQLRMGYRTEAGNGYGWLQAARAGTDQVPFILQSEGNKVGIGAITAPDGTLHVHTATAGSVSAVVGADDLVIESSGHTGMTFLSPSGDYLQTIAFGDVGDADSGRITYDHDSNLMKFWTEGSQRMSIDSAGEVGIGLGSTLATFQLEVASTGAYIANFNSTATDGGNVEFERSGTRRVVIGTEKSVRYSAGSSSNGCVAGGHTGDGGHLTLYGYYNAANSGIQFTDGWLAPMVDNVISVGSSSYRWTVVYATNSTINTSDEREKRDIVDSSLGLDFVNSLRPVSYRWRSGPNGDTQFFGMTAQDVDEVAPAGTAFVSKENPDSWGMRYTEFIAPMIKAIQELSSRVQELEASPPSA